MDFVWTIAIVAFFGVSLLLVHGIALLRTEK